MRAELGRLLRLNPVPFATVYASMHSSAPGDLDVERVFVFIVAIDVKSGAACATGRGAEGTVKVVFAPGMSDVSTGGVI